MTKYRKKPVIIEAVQFEGGISSIKKIILELGLSQSSYGWDKDDYTKLYIHTLEGTHIANIKDWIVKGIKGEFYPVKPDIFEQTYEKVD